MFEPTLTILRFPDLTAADWGLVDPIVRALSARHPVEILEVTDQFRRGLRRGGHGGSYWILSSDWRGAVKFLSPSSPARVFASVFEMGNPKRALSTLFFKSLSSSLPRGVGIIAHSALNFRFFHEIEKLAEGRLFQLPLALPEWEVLGPSIATGGASDPGARAGYRPVVATYAPFVAESNLHYFMNVAHYVKRRNPEVSFRLLGSGPLHAHLLRIVKELALEDTVSVVDGAKASELAAADIFLYVPLRNDHFGPLLYAAAAALPVLTNEVTGVENFVSDGNDGFICPVNETKPMGELVLRLAESAGLRELLGRKLSLGLRQKYGTERLASEYEGVLFGASSRKVAGAPIAVAS